MPVEEKEKSLEEVLGEISWRQILLPIALVLLVIVGTVFLSSRTVAQEKADTQIIIVVHSGESKTLHYNPLTHEEVRHEMADGCFMLTVKPKVD